jgi:hypothetical protein
MVHRFFPATTNLRQGQTTWISVAKNEVSSYGKSITETRMVPVSLTPLSAIPEIPGQYTPHLGIPGHTLPEQLIREDLRWLMSCAMFMI